MMRVGREGKKESGSSEDSFVGVSLLCTASVADVEEISLCHVTACMFMYAHVWYIIGVQSKEETATTEEVV